MKIKLLLILSVCLLLTGCLSVPANFNNPIHMIKISSPSFTVGGLIPTDFTCDGTDINPEIDLADIPADAKSLVLIVDDPDSVGGNWTHWLAFNLDPKTVRIGQDSKPAGTNFGLNDFKEVSYRGPCPPSGSHRYFFRIFALDKELDLGDGAKRDEVEQAMTGHILDQGEFYGSYQRNK
jgi:Raf kinase inhibitor-like YbhB/YbcL family protein